VTTMLGGFSRLEILEDFNTGSDAKKEGGF
jgi:hypothetical protein